MIDKINIKHATAERTKEVSLDPSTYLTDKDWDEIIEGFPSLRTFTANASLRNISPDLARAAAMKALKPKEQSFIPSDRDRDILRDAASRTVHIYGLGLVGTERESLQLQLPDDWEVHTEIMRNFMVVDPDGFTMLTQKKEWRDYISTLENALRIFQQSFERGRQEISISAGIEILYTLRVFWTWGTDVVEPFRDKVLENNPMHVQFVEYCGNLARLLNPEIPGWATVEKSHMMKESLWELFDEHIRPTEEWKAFVTSGPMLIRAEIENAKQNSSSLVRLASLKLLFEDETGKERVDEHALPTIRNY